jgi:hypothetical protein
MFIHFSLKVKRQVDLRSTMSQEKLCNGNESLQKLERYEENF